MSEITWLASHKVLIVQTVLLFSAGVVALAGILEILFAKPADHELEQAIVQHQVAIEKARCARLIDYRAEQVMRVVRRSNLKISREALIDVAVEECEGWHDNQTDSLTDNSPREAA